MGMVSCICKIKRYRKEVGMKNLNKLFEQAMDIVNACGIETGEIVSVTVNTRTTRRFGQCQLRGNVYKINISAFILEDHIDTHATMETIIHEILHTCKGCMNHGREWKRLANIIYRKTGYRITTTSSRDKFGLEPKENSAKYVFVCEECGQVIARDRMSKFVKHYDWYNCGKCGGKFRRER